MFHFPGCPPVRLWIHLTVTGHYPGRVPPFGYPGINAYLQLPQAFRSLSRPSSAISALASTLRSYSLDLLASSSPHRAPKTIETQCRFFDLCSPSSLPSLQVPSSRPVPFAPSARTSQILSSCAVFKVRRALPACVWSFPPPFRPVGHRIISIISIVSITFRRSGGLAPEGEPSKRYRDSEFYSVRLPLRFALARLSAI